MDMLSHLLFVVAGFLVTSSVLGYWGYCRRKADLQESLQWANRKINELQASGRLVIKATPQRQPHERPQMPWEAE